MSIAKGNIAFKRISKDLMEINKEPQNGIGIAQYKNDILRYVVNIKLLNGDYTGLILQLKLVFPDTYPINSPKISLVEGQAFTNEYHHHIYGTEFCFDLLANRYLSVKEKQTGWTSCYTLSSLLLQVQVFLSEPDFPVGQQPLSKEKIDALFKKQKEFKVQFQTENETITHEWDNPFPLIFEIKEEPKESTEPIKPSNKPTVSYNAKTELKENLTCSVLKGNYIEDNTITLGYPIIKCGESFYPIPEMLSYDAYINHVQNEELKLTKYFDIKYKSSMGEFYNCWFPIYISKTHFKKNEQKILNALTVIEHGCSGIKQYDFKPQYVLHVFPRLLNTMIEGLLKNTNVISEAFLCCYFHFVLLFSKLLEVYTKDMKPSEYLSPAVRLIQHWDKINSRERDEFYFEDSLILLLFSQKENKGEAAKLFINYLIKENIQHVIESNPQAKLNLIDYIINQKAVEFFGKNQSLDLIISAEFFTTITHWNELYEILKDDQHLKKIYEMSKGSEFNSLSKKIAENENLVQVDMYDDDFDFFSDAKKEEEQGEPIQYTDYYDHVDYFNTIKEKFITNPKKTIALCTENRKQAVYDLLQTYYDMPNYIEGFEKDSYKKSIENLPLKSLLRLANNVSSQKFMDYVYSQNPKNEMILIIYLTRKYFSDVDFMQTLEKNKGVLLQDQLYTVKRELRNARESIHNYTQLLSEIKCLFIMDNELEFYKQIYH